MIYLAARYWIKLSPRARFWYLVGFHAARKNAPATVFAAAWVTPREWVTNLRHLCVNQLHESCVHHPPPCHFIRLTTAAAEVLDPPVKESPQTYPSEKGCDRRGYAYAAWSNWIENTPKITITKNM
jgi:hypothetical protein